MRTFTLERSEAIEPAVFSIAGITRGAGDELIRVDLSAYDAVAAPRLLGASRSKTQRHSS